MLRTAQTAMDRALFAAVESGACRLRILRYPRSRTRRHAGAGGEPVRGQATTQAPRIGGGGREMARLTDADIEAAGAHLTCAYPELRLQGFAGGDPRGVEACRTGRAHRADRSRRSASTSKWFPVTLAWLTPSGRLRLGPCRLVVSRSRAIFRTAPRTSIAAHSDARGSLTEGVISARRGEVGRVAPCPGSPGTEAPRCQWGRRRSIGTQGIAASPCREGAPTARR